MKRRRKRKSSLKWWLLLGIFLILAAIFFYNRFRTEPSQTASIVEKAPVASEKSSIIQEETTEEDMEYWPESEGEVVRHTYYTLSFNERHKQANWVYYRPRLKTGKEGAPRTNNFREDPKVATGSAKPSDYTGSGYDRGHLCPAGDMTLSKEAMSETFYMSNMSPQEPAFNRGIWKQLEEQVRRWGKREPIYVVTGPVFKQMKGKIGSSRVSVPGHYYKVIYSPSRRQMIGFVLPNEKSRKTIEEYVVAVDSVERLTGIDFFPQLPDTLENRLEARSEYGKW